MTERELEQFEAWAEDNLHAFRVNDGKLMFTEGWPAGDLARAAWNHRAALAPAQPIYQSKTTTGWEDISEEHYDLVLKDCRRIVYAAPSPTKEQTPASSATSKDTEN